MRRALRYAVAVLVGVAATGCVAVVVPRPERELILLAGIAQVYAVGTAIALRYPSALRGSSSGNWASGAFAGVTTFGTVSLLNGVGSDPNLAVGALGWGLAAFGFVTGIAFERERDSDADKEAEASPEGRDGATSD